jgi:hypothetical protein
VAGDVGEGVVQAVVLVGPDQRTAAQQVERHGGGLVDPAVAGIGAVATVVSSANGWKIVPAAAQRLSYL